MARLSASMLLISTAFILLWSGNCDIITVRTDLGKIKGNEVGDGAEFYRIPYAKAPTGSRRFAPPEPVDGYPMKGINGTVPGPCCAQTVNFTLGRCPLQLQSEDCLHLNIFTPNQGPWKGGNKVDPVPVMVWFHGGAENVGTAAADGGFTSSGAKSLAQNQNVVVVTVQYRLGVFGFLADPDLVGDPSGTGGQNTLLDEIMALEWIHEHIEKFGGDETRVTLFGVSGGARSICKLLVSPLAAGLFQSVIQGSASCTNIESSKPVRSQEEAFNFTYRYLDYLGLDSVSQLRQNPLPNGLTLLDLTMAVIAVSDGAVFMQSSIDGYALETEPAELFETGVWNAENILMGNMWRDSFLIPTPPNRAQCVDDLYAIYGQWFEPADVDLIAAAYSWETLQDDEVYSELLYGHPNSAVANRYEYVEHHIFSDINFVCSMLEQVDLMLENTNPANNGKHLYYYRFGWYTDPFDTLSHTHDQGQFFNNSRNGQIPLNQIMVRQTQSLWGDFAYDRVGFADVNHDNYWWSFQQGLRLYEWNDDIINYQRDRCDVWEEVDQSVYYGTWDFTFQLWTRTAPCPSTTTTLPP